MAEEPKKMSAMEQNTALEVIALSLATQAFGLTLNGRDRYALERRVRELTGLPEARDGVRND